MDAKILLLAFVCFTMTAAKPSGLISAPLFASPAVYAAPIVTSRSAQVVTRNYNAALAPVLAPAPLAARYIAAPAVAAPAYAAQAYAAPAIAAPAYAAAPARLAAPALAPAAFATAPAYAAPAVAAPLAYPLPAPYYI